MVICSIGRGLGRGEGLKPAGVACFLAVGEVGAADIRRVGDIALVVIDMVAGICVSQADWAFVAFRAVR